MITGIVNKKEKEYSNIFQRYGRSRDKRYVERTIGEAKMVGVLKDICLFGTTGMTLPHSTMLFVQESIKKAKTLGYKEGLYATYKGEYIVVFLNVEGLDHSALKITHNEEERKLFNNIFISSTEDTRLVFSIMCLNLLREKQRIALLDGKPTYGMLYSNYPETEEAIDTFVKYINVAQAGKIVNVNSIYAVNEALNRGCTEEEIMEVIPRGTENKFFNVQWTDYELAQVNALKPNIKYEA